MYCNIERLGGSVVLQVCIARDLVGSIGPVRVFGAPGSVLTQFLTQF